MTTAEILIRFKPCPFCGKSDFSITSKEIYHEMVGENGSACIGIRCKKCTLDMYDHSKDAKYDTRVDKLVEKWNTRMNDEK